MANSLGDVRVDLSMASSQFEQGLRAANARLESFERDLKGVTGSSNRLKGAQDSLGGSAAAMAARFLPVTAALVALKRGLDVTVELQQLQTRLEVATGSAARAADALGFLQNFAEGVGASTAEAADAFLKLKNLGLDPSEKALRSYMDTAAGMGKSLDQLIEAVADASTGEFERLKEFGIKSSVEGDRVKFLFRGVTTEVQNSAAAIQKYLIDIGQNNFAGSVEKQLNTLGGSFANLTNRVDDFFGRLGTRVAAATKVAEIFNTMAKGAERFNEALFGPATSEGKFNALLEERVELEKEIAELESEGFKKYGARGNQYNAAKSRIEAIKQEMGALQDARKADIIAEGKQQADARAAAEQAAKDKAAAELKITQGKSVRVAETIQKQLLNEREQYEQHRKEVQRNIRELTLNEEQVRMMGYASLDQLREDFLARERAAADRKAQEDAQRELDAAIKREDAFTTAQEAARSKAEGGLNSVTSSLMTDTESADANYQSQMAQIAAARDMQLETAIGYDELELRAAMERETRLTEIERAAAEERKRINDEEMQAKFQVASQIFGNLSTLMNTQSKKMFQIGKMAAIANAVVNTAQGVTQALATLPPPLSFAAAASVAAAGAVQIATIRSQQFGGGGTVSAGGGGGGAPGVYRPPQPTIPSGPTGPAQSAGGDGRGGNITIVNNTSSRIGKVTERQVGPNDRAIIIEEARSAVAADMRNPNSQISRSMAQSTNIQRSR